MTTTTTITTKPQPTAYTCTNVHMVHVDDQCDGSNKNYLATYDAAVRDFDNWHGSLGTW